MKLKRIITVLVIGIGYGVTLHAIAGELYDKAGYGEILSFQGEWIGMAILFAGLCLNFFWSWRKQ